MKPSASRAGLSLMLGTALFLGGWNSIGANTNQDRYYKRYCNPPESYADREEYYQGFEYYEGYLKAGQRDRLNDLLGKGMIFAGTVITMMTLSEIYDSFRRKKAG